MNKEMEKIEESIGWAEVSPQWCPEARDMCLWPYYNHPKGCPNYGKRNTCPPKCSFWGETFHLGAKTFAIWNCFDFIGHIERMKQKHPNWSQRQLECCLYWQGTARKVLRKTVDRFQKEHLGFLVVFTPEAMGINITATLKQIGIDLEWPPKTKTYQVALASRTWKMGL